MSSTERNIDTKIPIILREITNFGKAQTSNQFVKSIVAKSKNLIYVSIRFKDTVWKNEKFTLTEKKFRQIN